ncbi:MAG: Signal transduction histidine-protein kinase ArlS [bacterium ADurb.Bin400]|nr:MAG: Signal transduction histidine-protein kinase ArlS [bacterium ADurb.Bin400]
MKIKEIKLLKTPFNSAYIKLTLFYVLVIMAISISFSFAIYQISSIELGRGLGRQNKILRDIPISNGILRAEIDFERFRTEQLEESSRILKRNLIYFNLSILFFSSIACYFLARKTMSPIEEALEAQNRFTADASHELRTPLTAMRTEIEVSLRDSKLTLSDARELLSSNLEEIGKLEALSGALLKLARYKDEARTSFAPVSLAEVAAEAYEKVEGLAIKKSIEFNNKLSNVVVCGDRHSLVELLVILLDNAIKYSPTGSRIKIEIIQEKHSAIVKVKDEGIGIKASDLPYIFNRFYRADTSRSKEKVDGYGLGLSIAKQIVDLHDGSIAASSKPGKGSTFTVGLPVNNATAI